MKDFFKTYNQRKDFLYYKIIGFVFMLSITILSIVFSINANVIKQYENYSWYQPFHILSFVNDQLSIEKSPKINELSIKPSQKPPKDYRHIFIIDRSFSTDLNKDIEDYTQKIKDEIYKPINKETTINKSDLDGLSLQEVLCLKMNLGLFQEERIQNEGYSIITSVNLYDGRPKGKNGHLFKYLDLDKNPGGSYKEQCEFKKGETNIFFYNKVVKEYIAKKRFTKSQNDRTNFAEIFSEIQNVFFPKEKKAPETIITIFSDFHHDVNGKKQVPFFDVELAMKKLSASREIHQVNLVRIPRNEMSQKQESEIFRLINQMKRHFSNAFYYHIYTPSLVNENDINESIKEILIPTETIDNNLIFYYPYDDSKLGISKEARMEMKINFEDSLYQRKCLISLHSSEVSENNINLLLKFNDKIKKNEFRNEVINIGGHVYEDNKDAELIKASFINSNSVNQFSDLSLNIYPYKSNSKFRVPIIFKEKLSKINSILLGVSTLTTLISLILFVFFIISDKVLCNNQSKKINSSLLAFFIVLVSNVMFMLIIWTIWLFNLSPGNLLLPGIYILISSMFFGFFSYSIEYKKNHSSQSPNMEIPEEEIKKYLEKNKPLLNIYNQHNIDIIDKNIKSHLTNVSSSVENKVKSEMNSFTSKFDNSEKYKSELVNLSEKIESISSQLDEVKTQLSNNEHQKESDFDEMKEGINDIKTKLESDSEISGE